MRRLVGLPSEKTKVAWLSHVRSHPKHQSKPDPGPFDNLHLTQTLPRKLGARFSLLRRHSGICLPAPDPKAVDAFKIWEMPGETHRTELPSSLLGQKHHVTFFDFHPQFSSRGSFILKIPSGTFHGSDHTLLNGAHMPIDWEPPYWALNCGLPGTLFRRRLARPQKLAGRALVLSAPAAGGNIWHFLFDSLPKLALLERAGIDLGSFDHILVDSLDMPIVGEALDIFGVARSKIVETEKRSFLNADELFYVTLGCLLPPDPWVLQWLRKTFLETAAPAGSRKIFINREGATRRRLHHAERFRSRLEGAGFETVALERLGLKEQAALLASAKAVVAPHGAGLTNLTWCDPGTKVVELFAAEYVNTCYWAICGMLGLQYSFAVGGPTSHIAINDRAVLDPDRTKADVVFDDADTLIDRIVAATC